MPPHGGEGGPVCGSSPAGAAVKVFQDHTPIFPVLLSASLAWRDEQVSATLGMMAVELSLLRPFLLVGSRLQDWRLMQECES